MAQYDTHSYGEYGRTVRIFRRKPDGPFYLEIDRRAKVLRHPHVYEEHRAIQRMMEAYDRLSRGLDAMAAGRRTVGLVLDTYLRERTPSKSEKEQDADKRRAEMWKRVLGKGAPAMEIRRKDWEAFIRDRASGRIDAHGRHADEKRPVRPRTVRADLKWLRLALAWATRWKLKSGQYLLPDNPVKGYKMPDDPNPRRAVATEERYRKTMAVASRFGYLDELLPIAAGTGRRLGSILALKHSDLVWKGEGREKHIASVRWRAEHDKQGRETVVAVNDRAREGLMRAVTRRPGIGETWLFPAHRTDGHTTKPTASTWLVRAERAAKLEPLPGALWHAYRRAWATARKHLPAADVAHAGGWKGPETLERIYQRPDPDTIQKVVDDPTQIREAGE